MTTFNSNRNTCGGHGARSRYPSAVIANALPAESSARAQGTVLDDKGEVVTKSSTPSAKIALFRSLFRGREDVYPRRFESRKTGRSGYQPACANEWVRGICEKPRVKCAD